MGSRILVVEHDEAMVEALEAALHREGLETVSAVDGASALQSFHEAKPDAVLLAVELGDESGIEVCQALRDAPRGQLIPILFMGSAEERSPIRSPGDALSHGGDYFFPLPNDLDYLAGRVRGWTADADDPRTKTGRRDTINNIDVDVEQSQPSIALSDYLEFDQESVTEHDYSPIPPILRVRANGATTEEDDLSLQMVRQAETLRAAGRIKEAIEAYAAAAAMYETDDEIGPALALYKLILTIEPGEYDIARHAGQLAARVNRNKDALEIYRRTLDALEARGQLENATFLIHEMLRLQPENASLRRRLQELELALGLDDEDAADASFDDLIAKEIGRSLLVDTLDLVLLAPGAELDDEDDLLSQDTLQGPPAVVELASSEVQILREALPRAETPTEDWSNMIEPAEAQEPPEETEELGDEEYIEPVEVGPDEINPSWNRSFRQVTDRLPLPVPDAVDEPVPQELSGWSSPSAGFEPLERAASAPAVEQGAFELAPLTMGGWSRLPVWRDLGDAPRPSVHLLSKIPPPRYGAGSMIVPARFVPVEGITSSLVDVVRLLARIEEQRATGLLDISGAPRIVFVEGQPVALRGFRAVHGFLALLLNSGKVDDSACKDLMANNQSERPVELARLFVRHGLLREQEGTIFLHRHFEDGLTALLRQHGSFEFDGSEEVEVVREEIVPEIDDVRRLLIDLLPRVAGHEELLAAVGGESARVRVSALAEEGPSRDSRFLAILDGRYELSEAARLAAMPPERAAALAFVYLLFGLATVVTRPRARSHLGWIPLSQPIADEPILSTPPKRLKPVKLKHSADHHLDAAGRLRALADLVNANDYFTILGVTQSADEAEVEEAYERLIEMIDHDAIAIDPDLVELAREVRRSLDEARDVLVHPELRAAYQQHLKP